MTVRDRHNLYLESRYRKLCRDLPQTIFWCPVCKGGRRSRIGCAECGGRGKLAEDSVQELIARRVLPSFRARAGRFHGAGREDIDVRMLGRGRPFVFELVSPRWNDVDLDDVLRRINDQEAGRLEVDPFRLVDRERIAELKEARFRKRYRAGVAVELTPGAAVDGARATALVGREFEVAQRTPIRVAHRRADRVRTRGVKILAVRDGAGVEGLPLELDIETQAGTYVKEWVSGDDGRSEPSLSDLLGLPAVCARLDVLEILDPA